MINLLKKLLCRIVGYDYIASCQWDQFAQASYHSKVIVCSRCGKKTVRRV